MVEYKQSYTDRPILLTSHQGRKFLYIKKPNGINRILGFLTLRYNILRGKKLLQKNG